MSKRNTLAEQIETARRSIRYQKKHMPWLFPLYHHMNDAEREYRQAKIKYEEAKRRWEEFGETDAN